MTRYAIEHRTRFEYEGPVRESVMELRMRPREGAGQACAHFALSIQPQAPFGEYTDPYGNRVHYFTLPRAHDELVIVAEATVEVAPVGDAGAAGDWSAVIAQRSERTLFEWLNPSHFARPSDLLSAFAEEARVDAGLAPLEWLTALRDRLRALIRYGPAATRADSPIDDCLAKRAGVCQDFAHVFITLARSKGIPCRYVSGYLFHREGQADMSGEDATHAWAEALVPGAGWVGFDPTNGIPVGDRHIRVAVGRDYYDVPPTRGVYRGPATRGHDVKVRVQRLGSNGSRTKELEV